MINSVLWFADRCYIVPLASISLYSPQYSHLNLHPGNKQAENVMGSLLTEYLGSPQQDLVVSESNSEVGATGKNEDIVDGTKNNGGTMDSSTEKTDNGESQQMGDKSDDHPSSSDEINGDLGDRVSKHLEGGHDQSNVANGNQNSEEASLLISEESIATKPADCLEHTKTLGDGSSVSNNDTLAATACQFKNFVAIVDPPRAGLHPTVSKFQSLVFLA
jgi:tRNA (uracil-5-)-methyltransferase